jgi:hypothetical protein
MTLMFTWKSVALHSYVVKYHVLLRCKPCAKCKNVQTCTWKINGDHVTNHGQMILIYSKHIAIKCDKHMINRWRQRDFHVTITGQSGGKSMLIVRHSPNLSVLVKNLYLRQCIACTRPWYRDRSFQSELSRRKNSSGTPKIGQREAITSAVRMHMFRPHDFLAINNHCYILSE